MYEYDPGYIIGRLSAPFVIVFIIGFAWMRLSKKRKLTKKEFIMLVVISVIIGVLLTVWMAASRVTQSL